MHYVDLLRSLKDTDRRCVGFTGDLKNRLAKHNEGASVHTAKLKPWKLVTYLAFEDERRAFEYYLKSGSGKAFANKRLW